MEKQISMAWLDSKMRVEKQHYLKGHGVWHKQLCNKSSLHEDVNEFAASKMTRKFNQQQFVVLLNSIVLLLKGMDKE